MSRDDVQIEKAKREVEAALVAFANSAEELAAHVANTRRRAARNAIMLAAGLLLVGTGVLIRLALRRVG